MLKVQDDANRSMGIDRVMQISAKFDAISFCSDGAFYYLLFRVTLIRAKDLMQKDVAIIGKGENLEI